MSRTSTACRTSRDVFLGAGLLRYHVRLLRPGLASLILAIILFCLSAVGYARPADLAPYSLVRVIDGDTIVVARGGAESEMHVRLLGIDCLETRRIRRLDRQASELGISLESALESGEESKGYVESVLHNQPLYIEAEEGLNDRYGRRLAYVWTGNGELLNLMLLSSGRARIYEGGKAFAREAEFRAAEREARTRGVGIWAIPRAGKAPLPGPDFPWPVVFGLGLLAVILVWRGYR